MFCYNIVLVGGEVYVVVIGLGEGVKNISFEFVLFSKKLEWKKNKYIKGCELFGEWIKRYLRVYGIGILLYDCDSVINFINGDFVVDVYVVVVGENSCILVLVDGVNWGEKLRFVVRCVIVGCL